MKIPRDWLKVCFSFAKLCPYSFKRITTSSRDYYLASMSLLLLDQIGHYNTTTRVVGLLQALKVLTSKWVLLCFAAKEMSLAF